MLTIYYLGNVFIFKGYGRNISNRYKVAGGVELMYPKQLQKEFLEEEEENIYSKEGRAKQVDDDAMKTSEDAFMLGYEEGFFDEIDEDELRWQDEIYSDEVL